MYEKLAHAPEIPWNKGYDSSPQIRMVAHAYSDQLIQHRVLSMDT